MGGGVLFFFLFFFWGGGGGGGVNNESVNYWSYQFWVCCDEAVSALFLISVHTL